MNSVYHQAIAVHQRGEFAAAETLYRRVLAEQPGHLGSLQLLGVAAYQQARPDLAVQLIRRAVQAAPDIALYHGNLAPALLDLGDYGGSWNSALRAVILDPGEADGCINLCHAANELGHFEDAERWGLRGLAMTPASTTGMAALGTTLHRTGRSQDALALLRRAIVLGPGNPKAHHNYGLIQMDLGAKTAKHAFIRSLTIAPDRIRFLGNLADLHKFRPDDPWTGQLLSLASKADTLPLGSRIDFHFTFAKMLGDLDRQEEGFRHQLAANHLKRQSVAYDETASLRLFERVETIFGADFLRRWSGSGDPSRRPIFIVGLPRSGTTLIEQILASHSAVLGAGELRAFAAAQAARQTGDYPDMATHLDADGFSRLGRDYLSRLPSAPSPEIDRVTDKMPGNLLYAGLIHLALPNAKILLVRRDPVDVALSCFSKQFAGALNYTYDLAELGRYVAASLHLMDHWERLLPKDALLTVRYEAVVETVEEQARRMLEFCGLPWEEAVLDFHRTQRTVRTASVNQVRRPLYKSSIGRWRPDAATLAPLTTALQRAP